MGDIVVVITRYFGGTKLGTGGLVRAYSDAVRAVLEVVPRGEKIPTHTIYLELHYNLYERVRNLIDAYNGQVLEKDFAVQVAITGRFAVEHFPGFQEALRELSHGALSAEIIDTTDMIVPVSSGMEAK
jgi:putative IMPACT (imprinted ancient) family translation regulator